MRLPPPVAAKPNTMPTHEPLRLNDRKNIQDRRKPSIQLDEEPAIAIRQPDLATHVAPQYDQLAAEHQILCFKPTPRLKLSAQERKECTQQPDHCVSLSDSVFPSTRIRFSVHTPERQPRSAGVSGNIAGLRRKRRLRPGA